VFSTTILRGTVAIGSHDREVTFAELVPGGYFAALGVRCVVGRPISDADDQSSGSVAVISERVKQKLYGTSNPVGQSLRFNGHVFTIVGVVPSTFRGWWAPAIVPTDIWLPFAAGPALTGIRDFRDATRLVITGRGEEGRIGGSGASPDVAPDRSSRRLEAQAE
jgi:hypothetical protein